jgi:hypothetical protein
MGEQNPYESPTDRSKRTALKRYENPRDLWLGVFGVIGGIVLLLMTAYFYFVDGWLIVWTLGGGIGILAVGALRLKSYFDDKRYSVAMNDLIED